jgi:RNA polymerase sigma-70 factor (ECF subfamily)
MDARDPAAFRALYREHYAAVCRYLAARTEIDRVEDVAAETFLVAWRRQAELPAHVRPWLLNTAGKCLANDRRSRERATALADRLAAVAPLRPPGIEQELARDGRRRALLCALAGLRAADREVLLLHHWDGLRPREIAAALDVSPVVARARLHRAGRRLERALAVALRREDLHPVTARA